eukprot:TRINITY_DN7086_c0_g1_i1.p1 TRINITY_DN7086_c0_g1~~TRINITY_DN7086_c0_g1_i1.p1  ORF type:complete len:360 (+),score=132.74 TRINITY_DN7086_c0_g1_i1:181-1260(+)
MDEAAFTPEKVKSLIDNMPTDEEITSINEANSAGEASLDKPELFCVFLNGIPNLKNRLKCWHFKLTFEETFNDILPPLVKFENGLKKLRESKALPRVFAFLVTLGNYMNAGNRQRGQADGFGLDILDKLVDVKDNTGKLGIIDYLVNLSSRDSKFSYILDLPNDLAGVSDAAKVSLQDVEGDIRKVKTGVTQTEAMLKGLLEKMPDGEKFKEVLPSFVAEAKHKVGDLEQRIAKANEEFLSTVLFFAIDPNKAKTLTPQSFLDPIVNFASNIDKIVKREKEKKEKEEKAAMRQRLGSVPKQPATTASAPMLSAEDKNRFRSTSFNPRMLNKTPQPDQSAVLNAALSLKKTNINLTTSPT